MVTVFNATLGVEEHREELCPKAVYDATVTLLEKRGFLGDMYVNHYGLIRSGLDNRCEVNRTGEFCIHYRDPGDERTVREIYDEARLTTSGFNRVAMRGLEMMHDVVSFFERLVPVSRLLPAVDIMGHIPYSLGINTPAGRQSLHYHMNDAMHVGVMQLFRPIQERDYYCLDVLKDYVFDMTFYRMEIEEKFREGEIDKSKRKDARKKLRLLKKISPCKLFKMFLEDPDQIKRLPRDLKSFGEVNLKKLVA